MSFAAPIWLAALALVPLAVVASVLARRRARRYAVRFPAVSTVQLLDRTRSWRRHLPAALALAAIAALVLALARPHVSESAPVHEGSVMLVIDESGSMAATDVQPTRLAAAERAANMFIDELPDTVRVGAIAFSTATNTVQAPSADHAAARALIDGLSAGGATATGSALALALQLLDGSDPKHPPAAIVLMSDGAANAGLDVTTVARTAAQERIPIDTVALGTLDGVIANPDPFAPPVSVPPDPALMAEIAQLSHGRTFTAQSTDELSSIYQHLGSDIGSVARSHEVTVAFAIGGLALVLMAAVASTLISPRVP